MNCTTENIYLYLDGELHGAERAEMERHLPQCASCTALMRSQQALLGELDGLADIEPPIWLERAIIDRAYDDLTTTFQHHTERRRALQVVAALGLTAAAFVRFDVVGNYLMELLTGMRAVGHLVWNIASVFFKGLSFVTVGMVHDLSGDMQVSLPPAIVLATMLSLMLVRMVMKFDAPVDTR
jgi:hypothetical protein